jgi:hypothetical protein
MTSLAINCDRNVFIHDQGSGELYSRVAQGIKRREIGYSRMKVLRASPFRPVKASL